ALRPVHDEVDDLFRRSTPRWRFVHQTRLVIVNVPAARQLNLETVLVAPIDHEPAHVDTYSRLECGETGGVYFCPEVDNLWIGVAESVDCFLRFLLCKYN